MLQLTYQTALVLHVVSGASALLLFWAPMLSRKGGRIHRKSGRWYYLAMMLVALSALILCGTNLVDPVATHEHSFSNPQAEEEYIAGARLFSLFLAQLAVMLFSNLQFGTRVLKVRAERWQLRSPGQLWHLAALLLISSYSGMLGLQHGKILLQGFGLLGLLTAISGFRYVYAAAVPDRAWQAVHVRNIVASGIAAYTAFFVVGGASWLGDSSWRLVPWVAPGVLGSVVITYYSRRILGGGNRQPATGLAETQRPA